MKFLTLFFIFIFSINSYSSFAQIIQIEDTFFLLKKKGLLKKLGKSIYRETQPDNPIKSVNPFNPINPCKS